MSFAGILLFIAICALEAFVSWRSTPEENNARQAKSEYMSRLSIYENYKKHNHSGIELRKMEMEEARVKYEAAAQAEAIAKALKNKQ